MVLSKSFIAGALASLLGLLLLTEIFLRFTVPSGFWYRHVDLSGDMTSRAEMRDRLHYFISPPPSFNANPLLLGDSVLGASALMEHGVPQAREKTLSRFLSAKFPTARPSDPSSPGHRGMPAFSLGSDGLLIPDIQGLTQEFNQTPPQFIILLLNFRMFSKDFAEGPKALSRHFLMSDLPEDIQKRLAPDPPPTQEARLSDRLYEGMCDHWFLFRETQMAKPLWYYPSQKDFFQRQLEHVVGKDEDLADMVEAALKQKVASYYQPYLWDEKALPFTCLKETLDQWTKQKIVVQVILTPQNKKFLGSYLDKPSFEKNRKILANFMKSYAAKNVFYVDWSDRYPANLFLDHCHLTPEGNERYATDIRENFLLTLLKNVRPGK